MTTKTADDVLHSDNRRRRELMSLRREDGLIILILKCLLNYRIWHWPYRAAVWSLLLITGQLYRPSERPELTVRLAADAYLILMGAGVVACYDQLIELANNSSYLTPPTFLVGCWLALPVFRLIEALSVVLMLNAGGAYHSPFPMRTISRTIWAYSEFIVIFAAGYIAIAILAGDTFHITDDHGFTQAWINPMYFSMTTITTVGFGNISPETPAGKTLVMIQVFSGFLLLVIALQRSLSFASQRRD